MAIPDAPLKFKLDPEQLTVDDMILFEPDGFTVSGFKAFMARYSNWTKPQIGQLTVVELRQVSDQLASALEAALDPKAILTSSGNGRGLKRPRRRPGSGKSSSPKPSTSPPNKSEASP